MSNIHGYGNQNEMKIAMKTVNCIRQLLRKIKLEILEAIKNVSNYLGVDNKAVPIATNFVDKSDFFDEGNPSLASNHKDGSSLVSINKLNIIWGIFAAVLLVPLIMMSINRGLLPVDDITYIYGIAKGGDVVSASQLIPNLIWNFFGNANFFRPISHLIFNIQYVLFAGNFWIFYLIKWVAKLLILWFSIKIANKLEISSQAKIFIAAFILFHPTILEARLFTSDTWLVLFYLSFLWMFYCEQKAGSIMSAKFSLLLQLVLWALFLGSKEVAVVLGGIFLVSMGFINYKEYKLNISLRYKYGFLWLIYALYLGRFFTQVMGRRKLDYDFLLFAINLKNHIDFLFFSPLLIVLFLFICSMFYVLSRWQSIRRPFQGFFVVTMISLILIIFLSSIPMVDYPRYAAARYITPLIPIVALIVAYGAKLSRSEVYNKTLLVLAFIYPIWQAPHIYKQYAALDNTAYEFSTLLRFSEPFVEDGYSVITTRQSFERNSITGITVGGEIPGAFLSYFGYGGKMLFNKTANQISDSSNDLSKQEKWILFSAIHPNDLSINKFNPKESFNVFKVSMPTNNFLKYFQKNIEELASLLGGRLDTFYDDGNIPFLNNNNMFYLYISCSTKECISDSYGINGKIRDIKSMQRVGSFF